jgi:hypothetical protein
MEWKRKNRPSVLRGASAPLFRLETRDPDMSGLRAGHVWLSGYVWAIGRTCLIKTTSAVKKILEITQKIDIQQILA